MPKKKKGKGKAEEGHEDGGAMSDAQQATMYRELNQALVVQMGMCCPAAARRSPLRCCRRLLHSRAELWLTRAI